MKKLMLATALIAAVAAPQAFAQAKNFEGFSVFGGLNFANSKIEVAPKSGAASTSLTSTSTNAALQAQYAWALGNQFVLGVGATVGVGDLMFGTFNGYDVKLKDNAAVYVAPGVAVSDSTLLYGKIAATSGTVNDGVSSLSVTGIGYGIGAQFKSGNNLFYQVEYLQNNFADKDNSSGTATVKTSTGGLSFGVGYKF